MKGYFAGLLTNYLGLGLSIAIQIFLMPFLLNSIGERLTGLYYLMMTISHFVGIGIAWLTGAGVYLFATEGVDDMASRQEIHRGVFAGFAVYATVAAGIVVLWGLSAGNWWLKDADPAIVSETRQACWFLAGYIWIHYIHLADISLLTALLQQGWAYGYRVLNQTIFIVIVVAIMRDAPRLDGVMFANLAGVGTAAVLARCQLYVTGRLRIGVWRWPRLALFKQIFLTRGVSYFFFGIGLFGLIYGDVLVIGMALGHDKVAEFLIIWKIPEVMALILGRISEILSPYLTRINKAYGIAETGCLFISIDRLQHGLATLAGVSYFFFGPAMVRLWVGEAHRPETPWFYGAAGALLFFLVVNRHDMMLHYALAKLGRVVRIQYAELAFKLLLMFLLFPTLDVVAPIVAGLTIQIFGITWAYRSVALKQIAVNWGRWLKAVCFAWICVLCISVAIGLGFQHVSRFHGTVAFLIEYTVYVSLILCFLVLMEKWRYKGELFRIYKHAFMKI